MSNLKAVSRLSAAGVCLAASVLIGQAQEKLSPEAERGRYLVEEVAKCQDCHTPRGADGELDRTRWLKGTTLDFQPIQPVEGWHTSSPDLTPKGRLWARWGEKALLEYMQTGLTPKGKPAGPPMPAYKMRPEDAKSLVEFLKTLK